MKFTFAFVLLVASHAQADSSCTARSLGATSMLAIQHTASRAKAALVDDDLPGEWYQARAKQHASGKVRLMQAKAQASHRLKAVASLERGMLSDSGSNASHHEAAAAAHNDSLGDYENNETKQLCRTCAEAGHSLMNALQAALAAHAAAEVKAVAMAEAKDMHEASSQNFSASLESFQSTLAQHQDFSLTYKSPRADFDELIRLANSLPAMADEAVQNEVEKTTHEAAEAAATEAYQQAHSATVSADEEVAAARVVEEEACKGLGLGPLAETTSSLPVSDGLYGHWDASVSSSLQLDGSFVAQWGDLSGKGIDVMALSSGSNRPRFFAAGEFCGRKCTANGHPNIYFSGNDAGGLDGLASEVTHPTYQKAPFTWFVVAICDNSGNIFSTNDAPLSQLNGGEAGWHPVSVTNRGYHGWGSPDSLVVNDMVKQEHGWTVMTLWFDGTETKVYWGSDLKGSDIPRAWDRIKEGHVVMGNTIQFSYYHRFEGYIGEAAAYTRALPEAEMFKVIEHLEQKWA